MMNIIRLCTLLLGFLFILESPAVFAHEIHLKSGSVIKTGNIKRSGSQLTYEQFGGMITISLSEVKEIRYDSNTGTGLNNQPAAAVPADSERGQTDRVDLAATLQAKLSPRTAIETANLSVVSITTAAGSGSGFFISEDGLIVTNRHVVRGSKENDSRVEKKLEETEKNLTAVKEAHRREKERMTQYERNLKRNWATLEKMAADKKSTVDAGQLREAEAGLKEKENYLKNWRSDYQARHNRYLREAREFDTYKQEFQQRNSELAQQSRFTITLADGSKTTAVLYRTSGQFDLALLKISGYRTPFIPSLMDKKPALGQRVFAIGSPLQFNNSVTSGVISGYRGDFVQTNAEIYPGNSGGPLLTEDGRVIGVNTMKMITENFEGLGFAINFSRVRSEFEEFLQK